MSTITTDDVHHLAQLSSLQLSDSEVENLRADLENIINHINQLNEVDTSGVEPTYQVTGLENVWRGDEIDAGSVTPEQLLDLAALVQQIAARKTTAREQVEASIAKAHSVEEYHALLSLTEERALARAGEIDTKIANGENAGVLAGVPFVVKDNYLAFGAPTTAASKMLEHFNAPLQATVVEKLEAAGAICIGKSNMDAFARGGST